MALNSLGIDKKPEDTRVVIAMSGGVDSSVTAAILHEEGYDVIGITLQLYDFGVFASKEGACCAGQDIYDAKMVADNCGFPHYVLNYESKFQEAVIDDFADTYLQGETPIPCVRCNQSVKFKDLLKTARDLDADCLATGHYIKRETGKDGKARLYRGIDDGKDQSYFLFATTQEQLDYLRFPLGGMTKDETRKIAERLGLNVAAKPDSQDICFVPNGDYAAVVKKIRPDADQIGDIVSLDGDKLGEHDGIVNYTIGQRKGLGLGGGITQGTPLYVVALNAEKNQVIVGPKDALARDRIILHDTNWIGDTALSTTPQKIEIKIRSNSDPAPGQVYLTDDGVMEVLLDQPQFGVSPGQACVCYNNNQVLGGGWIKRTAHSTLSLESKAA